MIKSASELTPRGIEIDLTGPDGNVFYLIGKAIRLAKTLRMTRSEINEIKKEMMSGDYEYAINYFDSKFGHFVTLYR